MKFLHVIEINIAVIRKLMNKLCLHKIGPELQNAKIVCNRKKKKWSNFNWNQRYMWGSDSNKISKVT